jgi:hypothetical protein
MAAAKLAGRSVSVINEEASSPARSRGRLRAGLVVAHVGVAPFNGLVDQTRVRQRFGCTSCGGIHAVWQRKACGRNLQTCGVVTNQQVSNSQSALNRAWLTFDLIVLHS